MISSSTFTASDDPASLASKRTHSFVTANLLLGMDSLGVFQNMPAVRGRLASIRDAMAGASEEVKGNMEALEMHGKKEEAVKTEWPRADFVLLQVGGGANYYEI